MSAIPRIPALAPFRVRSFRFQWPADLATSWAFEMETLILGWYVLVETRSVLMLTVFASLLYVGTLLAPVFGVMGDRMGHRNVLCAMRAAYGMLAALVMMLAFTGLLAPAYVLAITALLGLVRPSDIGMRAAVVGETVPADHLIGAMGIQRTTQDSARIAGALTGAELAASLGIGSAYLAVTSLYAGSVLLTRKAGRRHEQPEPRADASGMRASSWWHDLREGFRYVRRTPLLFAVLCLAFLLNLTAFPLFTHLLPYVAKEVYRADQTVLGYMVAGAASGALLGSILMSRHAGAIRPARMMVAACFAWYGLLLVFAHTDHPAAGVPVLFLAGLAQSMGQVPMAAILLRNSDARYRGRLMGLRMLAIYGNLPGLLVSGPLIAQFGYAATATLYCAIGVGFAVFIVSRWHAQLWRVTAPANTP